jgi:hypothetical protein
MLPHSSEKAGMAAPTAAAPSDPNTISNLSKPSANLNSSKKPVLPSWLIYRPFLDSRASSMDFAGNSTALSSVLALFMINFYS